MTARLSKRSTRYWRGRGNELVDWFNAVDLTYRTDLRELNELNELRQELAGLRTELRAEIASRRPEFSTELQRVRAELVFTMFVFWALNLVSTAGLVIVLGWH